MPGTKILSAFLIMVPATILLTAEASLGEPAAEACKASPGGAAPKGMHWYYRINRATNKHCWYLGPVGIHTTKSHASVAAATSEPATARRQNAADGDSAPPAQAMTADDSEAAAPPLDAARAPAPQPSSMQTASAQAIPAQVLPAAPAQVLPAAAASPAAGNPRFGARWPENLPNADEMEQSDPAPVSSYAEPRDADANGGRAAQASSGETVLRYFSIAGMVLIPLVLAAGWMAKFPREADGSPVSERLSTMLERLRPRRRRKAQATANVHAAAFDEAEFDEAAFEASRDEDAFAGAAPLISPAFSRRHGGADWRAGRVTDPAQDLRKSLTELMHDLRRAAEPEEPARYAQRSTNRAGERVLSPSLQPAE